MTTFARKLKVGKMDIFTVTINPVYLNGEPLLSIGVTSSNSNVTVGAVTSAGGVISECTGVTKGYSRLEFEWELATTRRSGCEKGTLIIDDC